MLRSHPLTIDRRSWLGLSLASFLARPAKGATPADNFEQAVKILEGAVASGQVKSATIFAEDHGSHWSRAMGGAKSENAAFLLGSISKPMAMAALMTLFDQGKFSLDDPAHKFLPEFRGENRQRVTMRHLLTHVSGLPDQLPNNAELRQRHAPLSEFIAAALQLPLAFEPGTRFEYSSMAILLASEIAQRLSDTDIRELVAERVYKPLGMQHSALGMGQLRPDQVVPVQVEYGAVEAGGGSAESKTWDWNSPYWRQLGAPWGGAQASAADVARFLRAFTQPVAGFLNSTTAQLMIHNQNPVGLETRGLGFDVGLEAYCSACSAVTYGHTGSTGTIAWADPQRERLCVVLTSLPGGALDTNAHPRKLASDAYCGGCS